MNKISEVSRRDIQDLFTCGVAMPTDGSTRFISWHGRMDEVDFLKRIYKLEELPSYDNRYVNAEGDIKCHTSWGDWENDWVFVDDRFELLDGTDEKHLNGCSSTSSFLRLLIMICT